MTVTSAIQEQLADLGFDPGPIDGVKGKKTLAAIKAFQKAYGLVVDGIAGPQTQKALSMAVAAPKRAKTEPDKAAINVSEIPDSSVGRDVAKAPPNASSLKLLDTARPIKEIIWHCAATPEGKDFTVGDIRSWHKQRGWSDIGYHYVVYRDGTVHEGRPIGQIGAHTVDHNTGTIGCCYIGGVAKDGKTAKDTRTAAQRPSMLWLTAKLIAKHKGVKKVSGHNQYAQKACPSFDVRSDALSALAQGTAQRLSASAAPAPAKAEAPASGPKMAPFPPTPIDEPKEAKPVEDFEAGIAPTKETTVNASTALQDATKMLLPEIMKSLHKASTPVTDAEAPTVAAAVLKEVAPILVNQSNNEPWYQSRVILGTGVAIVASAASILGLAIDPAIQSEIVDLTQKAIFIGTQIVALGAAVFALWGRIISKKPLGQ